MFPLPKLQDPKELYHRCLSEKWIVKQNSLQENREALFIFVRGTVKSKLVVNQHKSSQNIFLKYFWSFFYGLNTQVLDLTFLENWWIAKQNSLQEDREALFIFVRGTVKPKLVVNQQKSSQNIFLKYFWSFVYGPNTQVLDLTFLENFSNTISI